MKMKIDKRIILYFDGQMSGEEKISFEKEINTSTDLQKQAENYKYFLKSINETKNIDLDENYFTGIIPNFRKNFEAKTKKKIYPKIIYGLTTIAAIFIVFIFIFNDKSNADYSLKEVISNMNSNELNNALNDYPGNFLTTNLPNTLSDSTLESIIADELNLTSESAENILLSENYDLNKIYNSINDKEAEILYNELLKKKY